MRGLDPRIHQEKRRLMKMDCRVKPGNDVESASLNMSASLVVYSLRAMNTA
jgi:hypothetical protein